MIPTFFAFSLAFLSAMALHLMFPALPAGVNEPDSLEALARAGGGRHAPRGGI